MSTHLVFNGIDDAEKARLQTYWDKKLPRLTKLLSPSGAELIETRLTVSRHGQGSRNTGFEVGGVMHLPTGTLAAEADDKDPLVALDRVADALVTEIKRHKERVRRDYIYKRKNRDRANLSAAGPQLQRQRKSGTREDFFRLLRPHLGFLRDYARREIRILEREGTLHRGEVTVNDLIDAVLVKAWEEFDNRPRSLSLDQWLTYLLLDILEQWIKQVPRPHVSLEADAKEVMPEKVPHDDEEEWWDELIGDEERLTLGDLIPDPEETDAWEQLEEEERQNQLLSLLVELPSTQRHAYMLHVLEGYATDEIAMMQDRPESEVKADIEAARKALRDRLLAGGHVPKEKRDSHRVRYRDGEL